MTHIEFLAGTNYSGLPCFLCDNLIEAEDMVRYYGGPFVMHASCIDKLIDPHGEEKK